MDKGLETSKISSSGDPTGRTLHPATGQTVAKILVTDLCTESQSNDISEVQALIEENKVLKAQFRELKKDSECYRQEMEKKLQEKEKELSRLNLRITREIMDMNIDVLPGIMGNQENIMAIGNTGPKTPSETNSYNNSVVQCFVNVREIMWNHTISEELKKAKAEMARRIAEEEMGIDMLPEIIGNQENIMATGNTGPKILSERSSHNDSAVQVVQAICLGTEPQELNNSSDQAPSMPTNLEMFSMVTRRTVAQQKETLYKISEQQKGMGMRKKVPEENDYLPWIPIKREKKEDELSSQNWKVEFLGTEVAVQKPRKCDHVTRLLNAWRVNLEIDDVMLEIGPSRLTVGDLWTLLPPLEAEQCSLVTSSIRNFVGGWLVDKVVEAVLWKFTLQYDGLFCADSTLAEIVEKGLSTSSLWSGESFSNITRIFVPIMARRIHWTLLVLDKSKAARYYFDPLAGDFQREISPLTDPPLASRINKISGVTDTRTGWLSLSWPCIEPVHFKQKDGYNCGILICLFARCLCEGSSVDANFDVATERARITSMIFGCCYDDILERNINVCKVCRDSDGEDAEMRKRCGSCKQLFHASCIKVDSKTLSGYFVCPC